MAWQRNGTTTLGSASATISVASLTDLKFGVVLNHVLDNGSNVNIGHRLNGDSGSNYAYRLSDDGGADSTVTSTTFIQTNQTGGNPFNTFNIFYMINIAAAEKLIINFGINTETGASNAPSRTESVGKHAQTSNPVDEVTLIDIGAIANLDTDSNVSVLGTN